MSFLVKNDLGENISIIKVDVDKNPSTASFYGIQGVPTMILFKGGEQRWRQSGVISANELKSIILKHT